MSYRFGGAARKGRAPRLVVSHVEEDAQAAGRIVKKLERFGVACWIAPRDITAGDPFDVQVFDAIKRCSAVLLVFSERCNASSWVHREVTVADAAGKRVIPFRIEDACPEGGLALRLAALHHVDGFAGIDQAVCEVLRTLHPQLGRKAFERRRGRRPR